MEILGFIFTSFRVSGFEDLFGLLEDEGGVDRVFVEARKVRIIKPMYS